MNKNFSYCLYVNSINGAEIMKFKRKKSVNKGNKINIRSKFQNKFKLNFSYHQMQVVSLLRIFWLYLWAQKIGS